jgi:diguanylate cyclase (GGDEF)-like protein
VTIPAQLSCGVRRIAWLGLLLLATVPHSLAAMGHASFGQDVSSRSSAKPSGESVGQADEPGGREPPLSHIQQVRSLTPEQASRHVLVRLSGVVTAVPGYKNSFFFQDKTAGISVDRSDHAEVRLGDEVELTGTSGPGLFAPVVLASFVRVIGHGPPPPAPRKTLGDLFGGLEDSQWIELQGVVRSAQMRDLFGRPSLLLNLALDGGSVNLQIQDFASLDGNRLVDAVVRVRGVCASSGNEKRQFVGSVLLVPKESDLQVEREAPKDPFAGAARPIRDILRFGQWQHRVKVSGVVTYQIPGQAIYLQDGEDGIRVQTESRVIAVPGTLVEAVGFPAMAEYAPLLESGWFRTVGHASPLAASQINAGQVITQRDGSSRAAYDQQLVQVRATLFESHTQNDQRIWVLKQDNAVFEARLPISASSGRVPSIPDGSVLSVTGICTINVGSALNPISFTILLRSPTDIVVLKRGPWWTPNRVLMLLAGLLSLTILVLLWVVVLRNRVARQTRTIRESEGRFRFLAEHDGLTGLLNRTAILVELDKQLVLGYREKKTVTVVLGDIDHFKMVNDIQGHLAGDAALVRFAEALLGCLRPYDSVGRYGGEEFLLVLIGIPAMDVEDRLNRLHTAISNLTVGCMETEFQITCSLGVVLLAEGQNTMNRQSALDLADKALYKAKAAGRNRVILEQSTGQPYKSGPSTDPNH